MVSILLERRMGRFNMKPRYSQTSKYSRTHKNKDLADFDPTAHRFKGTRRSIGIYNRTRPPYLTSSDQPNKLPADLVTEILFKIFPKLFNRKGKEFELDEMNQLGMDVLNPQSMNFVERNDLICILFTKKVSSWYSFKDEKIYDLYNGGRFSRFRRTSYRGWIQDILHNRNKLYRGGKK